MSLLIVRAIGQALGKPQRRARRSQLDAQRRASRASCHTMRRLHAQTPCPPTRPRRRRRPRGSPGRRAGAGPGARRRPSLHIVTEKVGGKRATILAGTRFRVRVIVKPFAPGQQVLVTMHRRGRTIVSKTLTVRQGKTAGQVLTGYAPKGPGQIEVRAASGAGRRARGDDPGAADAASRPAAAGAPCAPCRTASRRSAT